MRHRAKRVRVRPLHDVKTDFVGRKVITKVPVNYDDVANTKSAKTFHQYLGPHYRSKPDHPAVRVMINERDVASCNDVEGIGGQPNRVRRHTVWQPAKPPLLRCKLRAGDGH